MNREVPVPGIIAAALAVVVLFGLLVFRGLQVEQGRGTADQRALHEVLQRTNGDPNKMSPHDRQIYNAAIAKGLYDPSGNASSHSVGGGAPAPSANPGTFRQGNS